MIVLLAIFAAMVLLGALADRTRRKREQAGKTALPAEQSPEKIQPAAAEHPVPETPPETQPDPAVPVQPQTAIAPLKIRPVRRGAALPPVPVMPPVPAVPAPMTAEALAERLRQIRAMLDRGELTKREYRRMRRRLLDSFCDQKV